MRTLLRSVAFASLASLPLAACADSSTPITEPETELLGLPSAAAASDNGALDVIVTFDDSEADPTGRARALMNQVGGNSKHTYTHALKGFSARMSPKALENLKRAKGIKRIEMDGVAKGFGTVTARSWGPRVARR
jgi:hypothetical protein